jgi:glycosyl transferase, family 25
MRTSGTDATRSNKAVQLDDVIFIYISLDRSAERRAFLERQLDEHQFQHQRFRAVEGTSPAGEMPESSKQRFLHAHGRHMRAGEAGCYLSHLGAMQQFLASDKQLAVILEDDAVLDDPERLAGVLAKSHRHHYDFLRLQSRRRYMALPVAKIEQSTDLAINLTRSTGSTGYVVNRKAATTLLAALSTIEVPFDHAFDRPQYLGLKYRHAQPALVSYRESPSTIETSKPIKGGAWVKAAALRWRAKTEIGRFIYALGAFGQHHAARLWHHAKPSTSRPSQIVQVN